METQDDKLLRKISKLKEKDEGGKQNKKLVQKKV